MKTALSLVFSGLFAATILVPTFPVKADCPSCGQQSGSKNGSVNDSGRSSGKGLHALVRSGEDETQGCTPVGKKRGGRGLMDNTGTRQDTGKNTNNGDRGAGKGCGQLYCR